MDKVAPARAVQSRTLATRGKILDGALHVLAEAGVPGLTHRAVASRAGVSLAATTYHFDTKADIVAEASSALLDGYLGAFRRMADRIERGDENSLGGLDDLIRRVVTNALGRERTRSLAWCALVLNGGRTAAARELVGHWYRELDDIWLSIAERVSPGSSRQFAAMAVDLTVGLTFMLHPLGLSSASIDALLAGSQDFEPVLAGVAHANPDDDAKDVKDQAPRYVEARNRVSNAATDILVEQGAGGVTYRSVAERAGMVRSGPLYYFSTIEGLIGTAQLALFERAKQRYRAGLGGASAPTMDESQLVDTTTTIYLREAFEFGSENLGHYSVWLAAANNPSLRPAVALSQLDMHAAWARRIGGIGRAAASLPLMHIQALFIGKLVRAIAGSIDIPDLSLARGDFAMAIAACSKKANR